MRLGVGARTRVGVRVGLRMRLGVRLGVGARARVGLRVGLRTRLRVRLRVGVRTRVGVSVRVRAWGRVRVRARSGLGSGLAVPTRRDHRVVVSDLYADAPRDGGTAGSEGGGAVAPKVVRRLGLGFRARATLTLT